MPLLSSLLHRRAVVCASSSSHATSRQSLGRRAAISTLPPFLLRSTFRGFVLWSSPSSYRKFSVLAASHASVQGLAEASQPWWQDLPCYQIYDENFRHFRDEPLPGDLDELEAFCRIFRVAEHMHNAVMKALILISQEKCARQSDVKGAILDGQNEKDSKVGDAFSPDEKVVSALGLIGALLHQQKEEVLGGRLHLGTRFPDSLPPLSQFRAELHRYCKELEKCLYGCFPADNKQFKFVYRKIQKLISICLDAGYPRTDDEPWHADIPNWGAVHLHAPYCDVPSQKGTSGLVLWKGGRPTEEGTQWLVEKGFKTIIDLRAEAGVDDLMNSSLSQAVSSGSMRHFWFPINQGSSPSKNEVAEFARLVADPQNHPFYFHGQVGLGRTFSLLSRLREFTSSKGFDYGAMMTGTSSFDNLVPRKEKEIKQNFFPVNHMLIVNENPSKRIGITSKDQFMYGLSKSLDQPNDSSSNLIPPSSPFEAQRPVFHSLSKQGMSKFIKNRQGASSKSSFKFTSAEGLIFAGNNEATTMSKNLILEPAGRWGQEGIHISRACRRDNLASANDHLDITQDEAGEELKSVQSENGSSATPKDASFQVAELEREEEEADEAVVGNMCSSTTGVVRLQSRKKAEMYLVRTDGFSCTREKVKESSLAFTHPSTQQQMLMWKTAPRTVLLLKKLGNDLMQAAQQVASFLFYEEGMNVIVEPEVHDQFARIPGFGFIQTYYSQDASNLHEMIDFVVCLGGDGVILHASNLFRNAVPPVVSFNLGSLGFLTAHLFKDFMQDLGTIIHGNSKAEGVYITLRMRLQCELFRNGKPVPGKVFEVLNEVVLDRGSNPYLCKIECYERNRLITKVQADGVIIATPTGSTAYSSSAGGSMVHPNVPCMLFTPICPHSLSFRPVILPDSALLELKVPEDARSNVWVSFDGKKRQQLSRGHSVQIRMSEHPLPTVNKSDQTDDWFQSLVRCLNWNERLEQKSL